MAGRQDDARVFRNLREWLEDARLSSHEGVREGSWARHAWRCTSRGTAGSCIRSRSWAAIDGRSRSAICCREYRSIAVASSHMGAEYARHGVPASRINVLPLFPTLDVGSQRADGSAVLFAGRMTTLKGGDLLVEAVADASRRLGRLVPLVMAGEGPQRARVGPAGSRTRRRRGVHRVGGSASARVRLPACWRRGDPQRLAGAVRPCRARGRGDGAAGNRLRCRWHSRVAAAG